MSTIAMTMTLTLTLKVLIQIHIVIGDSNSHNILGNDLHIPPDWPPRVSLTCVSSADEPVELIIRRNTQCLLSRCCVRHVAVLCRFPFDSN